MISVLWQGLMIFQILFIQNIVVRKRINESSTISNAIRLKYDTLVQTHRKVSNLHTEHKKLIVNSQKNNKYH